jgi:oleate hydratase
LQYDIRQLIKAASSLNDDEPFVGENLLRKVLKGTYFEHVLPEAKSEEDKESFLQEHFGKFKDWVDTIKDKF